MEFKSVRVTIRFFIGVFGLAIFGSNFLYAEIAESFGMGPRAIGTSGAGVASINDWTATYYNIAGVASPRSEPPPFGSQGASEEAAGKIRLLRDSSSPGGTNANEKGQVDAIDQKLAGEVLTRDEKPAHELGMGLLLQATLPTIAAKTFGPETKKNIDLAKKSMVYGAAQLGLIFDTRTLFHTPKNLPIRLGLAISTPMSAIATLNDTKIESYNFMRYGREAQRMLIITGVGAQVWKNRLSFGVGANAFSGGKGKFDMAEVEIDPTGTSQTPNAEVQMDLTPTIAPVAGVQYRQQIKNKTIMAGLSWRGEMYMEMNPLNAAATTQLLAVDLPLSMAILDFYSPHTFTLGGTYFHDDSLKVSLDLEMQLWNYYKINPARELYLEKKGISFNKMKNILLVRLGAEAKPGKYIQKLRNVPLLTRMGFSYIPAFTPDQTGYSNFLDNNKIGYSLGASYFLDTNKIVKTPVEIIFGFQHQIMLERTSTKSGDVTSSLAYTSGNQPNYSYSGHVIVVSLGAQLRF